MPQLICRFITLFFSLSFYKNFIKLPSRDTHSKGGLGHSLGLGAKPLATYFQSQLPTV